MEGEGDKVGEMVAESAPELVTAAKTTDIKLAKEPLPIVEKIQVATSALCILDCSTDRILNIARLDGFNKAFTKQWVIYNKSQDQLLSVLPWSVLKTEVK